MTFAHALVYSAMLGELVVLFLLVRRKIWKVLPLFSFYMLWAFLSDVVLYYVQLKFSQGIYAKAYLYQIGPDSLLQFGVLIELAWSVLRPSKASLPRGTIYVLAFLILLTGAIIWPFANLAVPATYSKHAQLFIHFQQTVAILRVVCFLVMAGFSQILAIGWKDRELQVASGFGFYAIFSLIVAVLHSHQTEGLQYLWVDEANIASYVGTLVYWVLSFSTKEQERREFSPQMQQILVQMGGGARTSRISLSNVPPQHPRKRD